MSEGICDTTNPAGSAWGWYLYGTVRRDGSEEPRTAFGAGLDGRAKVRLLAHGDLAAVVSRVSLAEWGTEAIRARVGDAAWLEAMVRGHERVVEVIHRQRTILPAKFGCVYAGADDLVAALDKAHDTLLVQIKRLKGCDEWGVRLYAHRITIRRRVEAEDPRVGQLQQDLTTARPGRAYFLQRKLGEVLDNSAEQMLSDLSQAGYDRLMRHALAGRINQRTEPQGASREDVVLLRAAFLVARPAAAAFADELRRFTEGVEGLRCEFSGPWPPYSFLEPVEDTLTRGGFPGHIPDREAQR